MVQSELTLLNTREHTCFADIWIDFFRVNAVVECYVVERPLNDAASAPVGVCKYHTCRSSSNNYQQ